MKTDPFNNHNVSGKYKEESKMFFSTDNGMEKRKGTLILSSYVRACLKFSFR